MAQNSSRLFSILERHRFKHQQQEYNIKTQTPVASAMISNFNSGHSSFNSHWSFTGSSDNSNRRGIIISNVNSYPNQMDPNQAHLNYNIQSNATTISNVNSNPHQIYTRIQPKEIQTPVRIKVNRGKKETFKPKKSNNIISWTVESEVFEDGWGWRKYGQKPIEGSPHPRSYYKCSNYKTCQAKKKVARCDSNPNHFTVIYLHNHNHVAPDHKNKLAGKPRSRFWKSKEAKVSETSVKTQDFELLRQIEILMELPEEYDHSVQDDDTLKKKMQELTENELEINNIIPDPTINKNEYTDGSNCIDGFQKHGPADGGFKSDLLEFDAGFSLDMPDGPADGGFKSDLLEFDAGFSLDMPEFDGYLTDLSHSITEFGEASSSKLRFGKDYSDLKMDDDFFNFDNSSTNWYDKFM